MMVTGESPSAIGSRSSGMFIADCGLRAAI
jgi:hypothetical protein